jgi:hypothetical protein
VVTPPDRHKQVSRLEDVLDDDTRPVIPDPAILKRLDEWNRQVCREHKDTVGYGQDERVTGDETAKGTRENGAVVFP